MDESGACSRIKKEIEISNENISFEEIKFEQVFKEEDIKPVLCDVCGEAFTEESRLATHRQAHIQNSFICDICKLNFTDNASLSIHYNTHVVERAFVCCDCGESFKRKSYLVRHYKIHKRVCKICNECFPTRSLFDDHKLTHERKEKFICDICGRHFPHNLKLVKHYRNCEKLRNRKPRLKKQSLSDNQQSSSKNEFSENISLDTLQFAVTQSVTASRKVLVCTSCAETFISEEKLKSHYHIYPEHKPFPCNVCKKSFLTKKSLMNHQRYHTKEKSFVCDVCGKGFYDKAVLKSHLHYSHKE